MDKNSIEKFLELMVLHKGKIIGTVIGFIFALLILYIGVLKTLLVFLFTAFGFYIGARWDIEGNFKKLLDRILPTYFK